jgi:peptidoglycan/LPS O-acetylase OafA/YrhL
LADWGHAGVPIFFVIAGFIMVWTTRLQGPAGTFMIRRMLRIYAGYIPIALAFLAYKASVTGVNYWVPDGKLDLWGSLLLFQTDPGRLLIYPTWTLPYELSFYTLFAACLLAGSRAFVYAFSLSVAAIAFASWAGGLSGTLGFLADPINLNFALGVAAGVCLRQEWRMPAGLMIALGIALVTAGIAHGNNQEPWVRLLTYGLGVALILPQAARWELLGYLPRWRIAALLGDASYAVYLLHAPLIFVLQTTAAASYVAWYGGPATLTILYILVLTTVSVAYFCFVERPLQRWLRGYLHTRTARAAVDHGSISIDPCRSGRRPHGD